MLYEVMKHIRNFFPVVGGWKSGEWEIADGTISLPFLQDGQYFLIQGSTFNDGVFQYPATDLTNETFHGEIFPLRVPKDFLELVKEIEKWQEENGASGLYQSESFNGYSYTRATNKEGEDITWKDAFKGRLKVWRKI